MTIFMVETYVIKPEKQAEFTAFLKKFFAYKEKHPQLFKEMKSFKIFAHLFGGNWGGYTEMSEFENLTDFEKWINRLMQSDFMTTLYPEFNALVAPATDSMSIWNPVK